MLTYYFKIALRNLRRNKTYAAVNILGLSLGIVSGVIIFSLINFQLGYDTFHKNPDRIYRITTELHSEKITYSAGYPLLSAKPFRMTTCLQTGWRGWPGMVTR